MAGSAVEAEGLGAELLAEGVFVEHELDVEGVA